MEINITGNNIVVSGRIDTVSSPEFEKAIAPVIDGDMLGVVVDCADLSYVSSSGLRLFLSLQKAANAKGGSLVLKSMKPEIKEIFDMTGFTALFKFE